MFGLFASTCVATLGLFTPYPFVAPFFFVVLIGGYVAVRFPELALYGLLAAIFFTGGNNPISPLRIPGMIKLAVPALTLWLIIRSTVVTENKLEPHQKLALIFATLFCAFVGISWLLGPDNFEHASWLSVERLSVSFLFFTSIILLQDRISIRGVVIALCIGAISSALLSIPLDTAHIENGREAGFMGDPNLYSAYLIVSVPLAAGLTVRTQSILLKFVLFGLLACLLYTLFNTNSRAGLLVSVMGLAAAFGIGYFHKLRNMKYSIVLVGFIVVAAGVILTPQFKKTFDRSDSIEIRTTFGELDRSTARRLSYVQVGTEMIMERPILGSGTGTFSKRFAQSKHAKMFMTNREVSPLFRRAHNTYIEVFSELGIVGFFLFAAINLLAALSLLTSLARQKIFSETSKVPIEIFLGISLMSIWLIMLTLSIQEMYIIWIILGLCLISGRNNVRGGTT